jgi:hypothetical protein
MTQICVPVSTSTFMDLVGFLKSKGSRRDPVVAVEDAINYWMESANWMAEDLMPEVSPSVSNSGYTWRIQRLGNLQQASLFLPDGTVLRISVADGYAYAQIRGDQIEFDSRRIPSPNKFALEATGTPRDAWRDVWVKRPTDREFVLSDDLREQIRPTS